MFRSRKTHRARSGIDTLIGTGTLVEGSITFRGGLRVDGEVRGSIQVDKDHSGSLVVSEKGRIEGEVNVTHLVVNGTVVGPVRVSDLLELQAKAVVTGDVEYRTLQMQQGAVVQGRLAHGDMSGTGSSEEESLS